MQFEGKVKKIICNRENWASFVFIYKENGKEKQINAAGNISGILEGTTITINGNYYNHPKYGNQIKFDSGIVNESANAWIERFLQSNFVKNIRKDTIRLLVKTYGAELFNIAINQPEKLLNIKNVGKKTVQAIVSSYENNKGIIDIYKVVNGNITENGAQKISNKYGKNAAIKLKKNPYMLIYDIDGFGFKKADALALASGIKEDSINRIGAGIVYVLQAIAEVKGHCFVSFHELEKELSDILCPAPNVLNKTQQSKLFDCETLEKREDFIRNIVNGKDLKIVLEWLHTWNHYCDVSADAIIQEVEAKHMVVEENRLYSIKPYEAEMNCAKIMVDMVMKKPVPVSRNRINKAFDYVENKNGYTLDIKQKEAVINALTHRLSVITGGPGTGKTTVTQAIIKAWPGEKVILCAPTGKASNRMSEVNNMKAVTIHRLIIRKSEEDINYMDISNNTEDKLFKPSCNETLIIGDEISMVNLLLANKLLEYSKNATLVLVGDKDQLPAIGIGSFFKNIVESKWIPSVKLNVSHRNQGNIALNAEIINEGHSIRKFGLGDDFRYFDCNGLDAAVDIAIGEYLDAILMYPKHEIICLAPMRNGVNALNTKLQDIMNPAVKGNIIKENYRLRVYDRVMETKNKYYMEVVNSNGDTGVFNGDCGTITSYNSEKEVFRVKFDDGREIDYNLAEAETLFLAYAATFHKSQGSEYQKVIILSGKWATFMNSRMGLYTAVTRAKVSVSLIGEQKSVQYAILNNNDTKRNTTLMQRIEFFIKKATT